MSRYDYPHDWAKERMKEAIENRERDVLGKRSRESGKSGGPGLSRLAAFASSVAASFRV